MTFPNLEGAACAEIGTDFFYLDSGYADWVTANKYLRSVCASCPVQRQCFEWAIQHEEFGWWGGYSARERAGMRKQLGIELKRINPGDWLTKGAA